MQAGGGTVPDCVRAALLLCCAVCLLGCESAIHPDRLPDGLRSASYGGIFDTAVTLSDGAFAGPPFVPGAASRPELILADAPWLLADLNGDDEPEYVVVLRASSGGSGTFSYLAVMTEQRDGFVNLATALVGDRVVIDSLNVVDGLIIARVSAYDAGHHLPAQERGWRLQQDALKEVVTLAGELVIGHEVREFDPCGDAPPMWVRDAMQGELAARLESLRLPAYQPVFAVVRAVVSPAPDAEFAEPYAEQVEILELLRMEAEGFGCRLDLAGATLRASGVEPFWRLDVKADVLELRTPDEPLRQFQRRSEPDSFLSITGFADDGTELTLLLRRQPCTDPMSGALYQYAAELSMGPQRRNGCALTPLPVR